MHGLLVVAESTIIISITLEPDPRYCASARQFVSVLFLLQPWGSL